MYTPWKRGRVLSLPCGGLETLSRVISPSGRESSLSRKPRFPSGSEKFFPREPQFPSGSIQCRVYSRARPCRIFHCQEKKTSHKIYVAASNLNGLQIDRPNHWQQHWFDGRSINSLWHFISSYCLNAFLFFVWVIISPKHPGFCSNSSPGFFSCPECSKMAAKFPASPTRFLLNPGGGGGGCHRVISFLFFTFPFFVFNFSIFASPFVEVSVSIFYTSPFLTQIRIVFTRKIQQFE